ncbi:MAG: HAD family hydrolase [Proteobacteria bacterium]|nr:HAD family hydrolase [Pseudomonadota bacterium]
MSYKAVLFDMDGTLLDTLTDIAKSTNRVLASRNLPQHKLEDYKYFVGAGATHLVTSVLPEEERNEKTIQECLEAFEKDYSVRWKENTRPYAGIEEMLDTLTKRGLKMAILSNKPHEITVSCVGEMLSNWRFEVVFGQRDDVPRKPDPAGALEISERMNIPPSDFLYLGDTGIDMKTAAAADMFSVGVLWGFRPREELLGSGAKALIEAPMDILKHIV